MKEFNFKLEPGRKLYNNRFRTWGIGAGVQSDQRE